MSDAESVTTFIAMCSLLSVVQADFTQPPHIFAYPVEHGAENLPLALITDVENSTSNF